MIMKKPINVDADGSGRGCTNIEGPVSVLQGSVVVVVVGPYRD